MEYLARITNIEWEETDANHNHVATHQPQTSGEAESIIQHYFSSSDIFDEEEERERTTDMVALYGIKLSDDRNFLASKLKLWLE